MVIDRVKNQRKIQHVARLPGNDPGAQRGWRKAIRSSLT
jgi:hypothetical protein